MAALESAGGDVPPTLLITHYPPDHRSGSIAQTRAALECVGQRLSWYSTKAPSPQSAVMPTVPYAHGAVPARPTREPGRSIRRHLTVGHLARRFGRDAARFGRSRGVEQVWGELSVEAVVASRVAAQELGVPLVASVFDDPVQLLRYAGYPEWTIRLMDRELHRTMEHVSACAVISPPMAEDYEDRFGIKPTVLYCGASNVARVPPATHPRDDECFVIGSVGSIPSIDNWLLLGKAVERLNERSGRARVKILHIGTLQESLRVGNVEVTGWIEPENLNTQLARIHAGFLSIWFDPDHAYSARTAQPTKLGTFLESGRPLLALGPPESWVIKLAEMHGFGQTCVSRDVSSLAAALASLLEEPDRYEGYAAGVRSARRAVSRSRFERDLVNFLGAARG